MKDIDVFLELYKEQRDLGLHHETQRSTVSSLLLTIAAILIGFITFDNQLTQSDLPATGIVVIIGIFGWLFTLKNYERFSFHRQRSRKLRLAIDAILRCSESHNNEDQEIRDEIRKVLKLDPYKSTYLIESLVNMTNNEYEKKNEYKKIRYFMGKANLQRIPKSLNFWLVVYLRYINNLFKSAIYRISLHKFWAGLHLLISIVGLLIGLSIIFKNTWV